MTETGSSSNSSFQQWYIDCCRRHSALPNKALTEAFLQADIKKSGNQLCSLVIFLDDLKDTDFLALLEIFMQIDDSDIDVVDILNVLSCDLNWEYVLLLLRAISRKLRVVDLRDLSFSKEFMRDLFERGLTSQVLNLKSSHLRKLNMVGNFRQLQSLNLDFSTSLTSFSGDCFTCMPSLNCLSLCETRISNLWTTCSALSKLPSLVELRFQVCLYTDNQELVPSREQIADSGRLHNNLYAGTLPFEQYHDRHLELDRARIDDYIGDEDMSDDTEVNYSHSYREFAFSEEFSDMTGWNGPTGLQNEISGRTLMMPYEDYSPTLNIPNKYVSYYPSPICCERFYRDFLIASLPSLKLLDHLPISTADKEKSIIIFSENFECLPYKRKNKESITNILQKREVRPTKSQFFYSRSLSAAKVSSCAWPLLHPIAISGKVLEERSSIFRARQFEYHPSDPSLMSFGTLDGEVVVINHENGKIMSYIPSLGAMNCVLGLCWLKSYPFKLIAGSDNGTLKLFDTKRTSSRANTVTFEDFDQLTSVHVNSTDELFLASGYSKDVALYDISSGTRLQVFTDMHREHINVVKFANHSPSIFVTSSFDQDVKMWDLRQKPFSSCYTVPSSRGNVMACFSPDDQYLLVSAVDNEVKQLLAADGSLHLKFNISPTGCSQNYTRSYYMNGRDYIISGSCDENVVRICCTQTGRRLRDISLEGKGAEASMFVQSLRGDPFRDFNMSILAAYIRPSSNSQIVKVNLLASSDSANDLLDDEHPHSSHRMGG